MNSPRSALPTWPRILTMAAAVALAAGCASKSPDAALRANAPPATQDYRVGPGDNLRITVWRHPEVSAAIQVRPDGKITTPLVEDLPATGKTATQLARDIEKELANYVQNPVVTVVVSGFVGPYHQIRIIGQAAKPQAMPYQEGMSLMDVLIAAGGLTEFAAGNRARIIRTIDGKQETIDVRLNDLLKRGDISANVGMRPGDVLIIPESYF